MKSPAPNTHNDRNSLSNDHKITALGSIITLIFIYFCLPLDFFEIYLHSSSGSQEKIPNIAISTSSNNDLDTNLERKCDMFKGDWVPYPEGPYYTKESGCFIEDGENCIKFGRPNTEYLRWRCKPERCELPLFDAASFLNIVRGKSMAFIGDSLARNHMQSLGCLLSSVARPMVTSNASDKMIRKWFYEDYNFTLTLFTTTYLIRHSEINVQSAKPTDLYLDEPDKIWMTKFEDYDYLIISSGHWFSRPSIYHENDKVVGCFMCNTDNITDMSRYFGYRQAFKVAFSSILNSQKFKGSVILRTISPTHFEAEEWEGRGNCRRTKPFTKQEIGLDWYLNMFHSIQIEEFRQAAIKGKEKGIKFNILDITEAMRLRPDGHPNLYGPPHLKQNKRPDCLHWCLPGVIDMWNELLLELLKKENEHLLFD